MTLRTPPTWYDVSMTQTQEHTQTREAWRAECVTLAYLAADNFGDSFGPDYADDYRHATDCKCSECVL